ncbi:hypothetical protein [Kitasatospora phosalacinea]|uniref:Uncharacterized protein n=1 Tax=Kitasatospora phosalacinea TaxID=2065 RepID=A0A9W6UPQ5_9ACTN|nr:hypothetical protein Kpho01_57570 [Kitasatospora phosalacinea]
MTTPHPSLADKAALVAGGTRGAGRGIAVQLGAAGPTWREDVAREPQFAISESTAYVGRAVAHLAADEQHARWNGRSTSSGEPARHHGFTDLDGSRPDCWALLTAAEGAEQPPDPERCR